MNTFNNKTDRVMQFVFGLVGTAMVLVASYGVFARDVLRISAPWTDELLKLLDIWMIFVVSSVVFLFDEQISLTLVEDSRGVRRKPVVYHLMKVLQYALAGILNAEMFRELIRIIGTQIQTGESTTVIKYPLYLLNIGMFIGCVLTVIFAAIKIVYEIKNLHKEPGFIE